MREQWIIEVIDGKCINRRPFLPIRQPQSSHLCRE